MKPNCKKAAGLAVAFMLATGHAAARPPQVLPEPMLFNLFLLTDASATLRICEDSAAYSSLTAEKKALLNRLQSRIEGLVREMAEIYDDELYPFFVERRNETASRTDQIEDVRSRYGYCGDALFKKMKRYVYDSRQKLQQFLSQQPKLK